MKVCVDAGHGGTDPGAVGPDPFGLEEKKLALQIALVLEEELESQGHWVVMTRRRDRTLGLFGRAHFANRLAAELFVSIHANGAATPVVEGMEVFHFPGSPSGGAAASTVLESMLEGFPDHANRGVKEANFTVLRETRMPAILIEAEFITNPRQLAFLSDPDSQRGLALAITTGVSRISGV